eukprot:5019460-Alexandrium_andersonii.AAC.1
MASGVRSLKRAGQGTASKSVLAAREVCVCVRALCVGARELCVCALCTVFRADSESGGDWRCSEGYEGAPIG